MEVLWKPSKKARINDAVSTRQLQPGVYPANADDWAPFVVRYAKHCFFATGGLFSFSLQQDFQEGPRKCGIGPGVGVPRRIQEEDAKPRVEKSDIRVSCNK